MFRSSRHVRLPTDLAEQQDRHAPTDPSASGPHGHTLDRAFSAAGQALKALHEHVITLKRTGVVDPDLVTCAKAASDAILALNVEVHAVNNTAAAACALFQECLTQTRHMTQGAAA